MIRPGIACAIFLALGGCGVADGDGEGAGGLTAAQADALNRAAARADVQDEAVNGAAGAANSAGNQPPDAGQP